MAKMESNVINSFQLVKADIIRLQDNYMELKKSQSRILEKLANLESKRTKKPVKRVKNLKVKKKPALKRKTIRKTYVASKTGKKFHLPTCPFAQNIKPKTKLKFKTKTKPLSMGYKPCSCIK